MRRCAVWVLFLGILVLPACTQSAPSPSQREGGDPASLSTPPAADFTYEAFVSALRLSSLPVKELARVHQSFLTVTGRTLLVNGERLQVFEFPTERAAARQAKGISADGYSVGGPNGLAMVEWIDAPHFFRRGAVMALYVGQNRNFLALLTTDLGPQFAGT